MKYKGLKQNFPKNQEQFPDIKVVDRHIYIRTVCARGDKKTDENFWKLWTLKTLSRTILKRSQDSVIASRGWIFILFP